MRGDGAQRERSDLDGGLYTSSRGRSEISGSSYVRITEHRVHGAPIRPLTDTTVPETEFPDPYNLGTALLVLRMQYTQDHHEMNTTLRAREPQATAARSKRVQQGATE